MLDNETLNFDYTYMCLPGSQGKMDIDFKTWKQQWI